MSAKLTLKPGREKSLRRRHPWVFAGAVAGTKGKLHSGDTVEIHGSDGRWLGRAAWSPKSQIQARVWTFDENQVVDNVFFLRRIERALKGRSEYIKAADLQAYRLVAGESDGLPGLTVDRYGDILVCQLLSAGAERHREKIVWALNNLFPEAAVFERSDADVRSKEGLPPVTAVLHGEVPDEVMIEEAGLKILVDVKQGHKTGFYLDQRENRALIAAKAENKRVLNCFSYTGAVALHCLRQGAAHVTNLDSSEQSLALAARNLELNAFESRCWENQRQDAFQALRDMQREQQRFDMVVLDPPKFVDAKQHLTKACRGYKDINMQGIHVTEPGGILCTFSCSGLMPEALFQKVIADAALDAGRELQFISRLGQAPDHPVAASFPEGFYLKGFMCRVW